MSLLKFNNYTSVDGRIVKAYDLPREEIDQLNLTYEEEKKKLDTFGHRLAGRLSSELDFTQTFQKTKIYKSIVECMNDYINSLAYFRLLKEHDYKLEITSCWINDMKEGEYNPPHIHHDGTGYSTVLFLKIPELINDTLHPHKFKDGKLAFSCINGDGCQWINPEVGHFFIFEARQQHQVMPFRPKKKGETRRSLSFNFHILNPVEPVAPRFVRSRGEND